MAAYVRRRRLELAATSGRPDVAEVAARWHFADSSHFARAFKHQYGETPTQFAVRAKRTGNS
jgi:AraC-like DNA-binding protein